MSVADWYGCKQPHGELEEVQPTPEIVQSAGLHLVPGARLTSDLMGVKDSRGYVTRFYLLDGSFLCARVFAPDGTSSWIRRVGTMVNA